MIYGSYRPGRYKKARVFFLLFTLACLGLTIALAFGAQGRAAAEIARPNKTGKSPYLPAVSWQEGLALDINVPVAEDISWRIKDNALQVIFTGAETIAALPSPNQFIDQNIHLASEEGKAMLLINLEGLPPIFSLRPTSRGYSIQWLEAGLRGKKIAIDPGHGGTDPGAVGLHLRLLEKDVTLPIALELRALLEKAGAEVLMTRTTDALLDPNHRQGRRIKTDLQMRRARIDEFSPDFSISIHHNSWKTGSAQGLETFYNPDSLNSVQAKRAAKQIHQVLVEKLQRKDRGVKIKGDAVLQVKAPAVLAEILYISNKAEEEILASPDFPSRAAAALFEGIAAYFQEPGGE